MHSLNFAATADEYYQRANDEILVVLQTESPRASRMPRPSTACPAATRSSSARPICGSPCGPPTAVSPPAEAHEAMIQRALAIAREARVPLGMHVMDPATALARAAQGMQFIAVATDLRMLTVCAEEFVAALWPDRSGK